MVFSTIRVMCMANANIQAALFAWAFVECLMLITVIVDMYGKCRYTCCYIYLGIC